MEFNNISDFYAYVISHFNGINIAEKLFSVAVTLIVMFICMRITSALINHFFKIREKTSIVETHQDEKRNSTLRKVTKSFARTAILTVGGLIILSYFIDVSALLAVAGIGTVAVGLGARGLVEDMMSGLVIIFENQFSVGDYVTLDTGRYGMIENIGIRSTSLRLLDGSLYIVHNGKIDRVINHSKGWVKAVVEVGIAYDENVEKVKGVIDSVCDEVFALKPDLFKNKPLVLGVTRLDPSAVNIRIEGDVDAGHRYIAERYLRQRIKEVFDEKGIEIPYDKSIVYIEPGDLAPESGKVRIHG